jgi:hypothetical protein
MIILETKRELLVPIVSMSSRDNDPARGAWRDHGNHDLSKWIAWRIDAGLAEAVGARAG